MRRILIYIVLCAAMLAAAVSCTDYNSKLEDLRQQLDRIEQDFNAGIGGADIQGRESGSIHLSLSGYEFSIKAGETIALSYLISGTERETDIEVLCSDGWSAVVNSETETSGHILLEAGPGAASGQIIVFVGDGKGRLAQSTIQVEVNLDQTQPPDPPAPDPVIVPAKKTVEVGAEGGTVEVLVYSNTDYSVSMNCAWASYVGTKAVTAGTLLFEVEPNTSNNRAVSVYLSAGSQTVSFVIRQARAERPPQNLPTMVSHVMPCCRVNNRGTSFLVNGSWTTNHSYSDLSQVLDIFQNIKDAGINVVCVDFSNASQWDDYGESALHNGDGGEFWRQFGPMIDVIVEACRAKEMKFFFLVGNITTAGGIGYWNGIARRIWENWAQLDVYQHYGYGDDRPLLVCFLPGTTYAATLRRAASANKNYLEKFRIGTCQINSAITPTTTDGWGYRNYSGSSDGKVRFACPNSGVPPSDWARVDDVEWKRRVHWALGASEYAILGSYDDTCDAIFWGIADVRRSTTPCHRNEATEGDPLCYYNIVRKAILGLD